MSIEHHDITRAVLTGYPYSPKRQMIRTDGLGREVHSGDEILEFMDDFYLVDELSIDAQEILEQHGAVRKIAR